MDFLVYMFHTVVWLATAIGLIVLGGLVIAGLGTVLEMLDIWRDNRYIAKSNMVITQDDKNSKRQS